MLYQLFASILSAVFIATVYYLIVLFQFPSVSLSSGYWLGGIVVIIGIIRFVIARTNGQKSDAKVFIIAGILLFIATYVLLFIDFQI